MCVIEVDRTHGHFRPRETPYIRIEWDVQVFFNIRKMVVMGY